MTLGSRSPCLSLSPGSEVNLSTPFDLLISYLSPGIFSIVFLIYDFHSIVHERVLSIFLTEKTEICQESFIEPLGSVSNVFIFFQFPFFFWEDINPSITAKLSSVLELCKIHGFLSLEIEKCICKRVTKQTLEMVWTWKVDMRSFEKHLTLTFSHPNWHVCCWLLAEIRGIFNREYAGHWFYVGSIIIYRSLDSSRW